VENAGRPGTGASPASAGTRSIPGPDLVLRIDWAAPEGWRNIRGDAGFAPPRQNTRRRQDSRGERERLAGLTAFRRKRRVARGGAPGVPTYSSSDLREAVFHLPSIPGRDRIVTRSWRAGADALKRGGEHLSHLLWVVSGVIITTFHPKGRFWVRAGRVTTGQQGEDRRAPAGRAT